VAAFPNISPFTLDVPELLRTGTFDAVISPATKLSFGTPGSDAAEPRVVSDELPVDGGLWTVEWLSDLPFIAPTSPLT
jgi:hypothetical protein